MTGHGFTSSIKLNYLYFPFLKESTKWISGFADLVALKGNIFRITGDSHGRKDRKLYTLVRILLNSIISYYYLKNEGLIKRARGFKLCQFLENSVNEREQATSITCII